MAHPSVPMYRLRSRQNPVRLPKSSSPASTRPVLAGGPLPRPPRKSGIVLPGAPHSGDSLRIDLRNCRATRFMPGWGRLAWSVSCVMEMALTVLAAVTRSIALPVEEKTGLPYASTARGTDQFGNDVSLMHACGHDIHMTCLLGAASLLADAREHWHGSSGDGVPTRRGVR